MAEPKKGQKTAAKKRNLEVLGSNGSGNGDHREKPAPLPETPKTPEKVKGAKARSATERAGLRGDILEEEVAGVDRETVEMILGIDINHEIAEQMPRMARLELATHTLVTKLLAARILKDNLCDLKYFKNFDPTKISNLNGPEKAALKKLQEIATHEGSPLFEDLQPKWGGWLNKINALFETCPFSPDSPAPVSAALRAAAATPPAAHKAKGFVEKVSNTAKGVADKVSSGAKKIWDKVGAFADQHPVAFAFGAALVAYGAYKFFFGGKDDEDTGKSKESFFSRIGLGSWSSKLKVAGGGLLGLFTLGAVFGPDRIKKIVEDLARVPKDIVDRVVTKFKEGNIAEGLASIVKGKEENFEEHKVLAEKLTAATGRQINTKTIADISNVSYENFMKLKGSYTTALYSLMLKVGHELKFDSATMNAAVSKIPNNTQQAEEEEAIRTYLEKNKSRITELFGTDLKTVTVVEILAKLNDIALKPSEKNETLENIDSIKDTVNTGLGEVAVLARAEWKALRDAFKGNEAFQKFAETYQDKHLTDYFSWKFVDDLLTACHDGVIPMVVVGGTTALWTGYQWAVLTTAKTLTNTIAEVVKAPFSDQTEVTDVFKTYMISAVPFMIIGSLTGAGQVAWNALFSEKKGLPLFKQMWKGVKRGAIFPVELAKLHGAVGARAYHVGRGLLFEAQKLKAPLDAVPQIMADKGRFYAEASYKYKRLVEQADMMGNHFKWEKWWGKLNKERALKLKDKYFFKAVDTYNDLQIELKNRSRPYATRLDVDNSDTTRKRMRDFVNEERAKLGREALPSSTISGTPPTITSPETPALIETKGTSTNVVHRYRLLGQDVELAESDITTRASEITAKKARGSAAAMASATEDFDEAVRQLAEEKLLTPEPIAGKTNRYRFQGQEFNITPAEISAKTATGMPQQEAIKTLCFEKAVQHLTIEDVAIIKGKYRYKINGQWVDNLEFDNPAKMAEVKAKFAVELQKKGVSLDFQKFARESKSLVYFPAIERILGTAAAVAMIYHLETATDKRKAVAETAAGFGAFYAGMKLTDWTIANKLIGAPTTPVKLIMRTVIDLMGGLAASFSLTEPIGKIVEDVMGAVPGSHAASAEVADIFEKATARGVTRMIAGSLERGLLRKGLEKAGAKSIISLMEKRVSGTMFKSLAKLGQRQGMKQILKMLGRKGATTAALLADDITVIGILDDLIAVGLTISMIGDIMEIRKLISNAAVVQNEMAARKGKEIQVFTVRDRSSKKALEEKLAPLGTTLDTAAEKLSEDELFGMLHALPYTVIDIYRKDMPGKETWTLQNGEMVGIEITDETGNTIGKITNEDAINMDKALAAVEKENIEKNGGGGEQKAAA